MNIKNQVVNNDNLTTRNGDSSKRGIFRPCYCRNKEFLGLSAQKKAIDYFENNGGLRVFNSLTSLVVPSEEGSASWFQ
ncbi:MAG: hypothetical protein U9O94_09360, partial [Nanoarchaeota archaeon]|nr:hypothetical protein [Nanoarchaeota archaeon]